MRHLEKLWLRYTNITDKGLEALEGLPELNTLILDGSFRITDAGLRLLGKMKNLKNISLTFTRLTDQGVEELRQMSTKLIIQRRYVLSELAREKEVRSNKASSKSSTDVVVQYNFLKYKASKFNSQKDWIGFALILEEMINTWPHAVFPWDSYAWNLAYNLSNEWDDLDDRYFWTRQGIAVMLYSDRENPNKGKFIWTIGWLVSRKIGRSDDHRQYRRLFAEDNELLKPLTAGMKREDIVGVNEKPDNFLVARQWFLKAEPLLLQAHEQDAKHGKSPLIFYSNAPMCQIFYAQAIEEEGTFGEVAAKAWKEAEQQWNAYGDKSIPTSYDKPIRLNDLSKETEEQAILIRRYRNIVNYDYWKTRCKFEQLPSTLEGRKLLYEAVAELKKVRSLGGDVSGDNIRGRFERAFKSLRQSFDADPSMLEAELSSPCFIESIAESIALYQAYVLRVDRLPDDFPLKPLIDGLRKRSED